LTAFALDADDVRTVIAHTLPEENASARVLRKSGFEWVGDVVDPEDGPVWRWEFRPAAKSGERR
jgi:RimJ/RimL family protein N-acetyltransferase